MSPKSPYVWPCNESKNIGQDVLWNGQAFGVCYLLMALHVFPFMGVFNTICICYWTILPSKVTFLLLYQLVICSSNQ